MNKKVVAVTTAAVVVGAGIGGGAWMAFGADGEKTERGACAGTAYELNVGEDDGALELEYELQSSGPGEVWQVLVEQGDTVVLDAERSTDEDGELDLDAVVDSDGSATYVVTATPAGGEPCVASLTR